MIEKAKNKQVKKKPKSDKFICECGGKIERRVRYKCIGCGRGYGENYGGN